MVKASSYLAANIGPPRTYPMLSMDRAQIGDQVSTHQVEEHTGTGAAPDEIPTTWPAWAVSDLVNCITGCGINWSHLKVNSVLSQQSICSSDTYLVLED